MSTTRYIFGLLLLAIGVLMLLSNLNYLNVNWAFITQFWPVLLILLGIGSVTKNKNTRMVLVTLAVLVTIGIVALGVQKGWLDPNIRYNVESQDLAINYLDEETATLNLESGAGKFNILADSEASAFLIGATAETNLGQYTLQRSGSKDNIFNLKLASEHMRWGHIGTVKNDLDIILNTKPIWRLNIDAGAAELNLDLSKNMVEDVQIDTGATDVQVKIKEANVSKPVKEKKVKKEKKEATIVNNYYYSNDTQNNSPTTPSSDKKNQPAK